VLRDTRSAASATSFSSSLGEAVRYWPQIA
jgi:hypothetical protein